MSSSFESMVNEMVRWSTTPETREKKPDQDRPEAILEDEELDAEDELDADDELDIDDEAVSRWPSSGRTNLTDHKKAGSDAS